MGHRIASARGAAVWAATAVIIAAACAIPPQPLPAQTLSFGQVRPFVVGFIPVVGRGGAVGGVLVDAGGIVARAEIQEHERLHRAWRAALQPLAAEVSRPAPLRKVSLRRLEEAIAARLAEKRPLTDELNCLAGMQRVQYVFVYPEQRDLVLAGPAEGWRVTQHGAVVGQHSGRPVLMLEDLVVALRSADAAAASGISCSIDPTDEGVARLRRALRTRPAGPALIPQLEQILGPQTITVEGVPPESRFARVMVAADFLMKRLGMGFEPAPVDELPSYLQMIAAGAAAPPRTITPRWWLAPDYAPLGRDGAGLAWEIGARSMKTLAEDGRPASSRNADAAPAARSAALTQQWADRFTSKYDELAMQIPVFAELQNCIDLAVVAALVEKEDLRRAAGLELKLLLDAERVPTGIYPAPQTAPSLASAVPKGNAWIVSVSGGVEADPQQIASQREAAPGLASLRAASTPPSAARWWWD
jgi:hypothetical protein